MTSFWRLLHNCVAHPLLEILPERWGDWLHDQTATKAFALAEDPVGGAAMRTNDGREVSAVVLVICDGDNGRGIAGYMREAVVEEGGLALTFEEDVDRLTAPSVSIARLVFAADIVAVGGETPASWSSTGAERRSLANRLALDVARETGKHVVYDRQNLAAWFEERRQGKHHR